jgi:hypothetical protein
VELPDVYSNVLCGEPIGSELCSLPKWDHNRKGFEREEVRIHDYVPRTREHHPETERFWDTIWGSAISELWVDADVPLLLELISLVDRFNWGDMTVAGEIRQRAMGFGLTPIDRRRLEWSTLQVEDATVKRKATARTPATKPGDDPRRILRSVS